MIVTIINLIQLGVLLFALTILLVFIGTKSKKDFYKYVFYNSAAVLFSLFIYETVILNKGNKKNARYCGDYVTGNYFYKDTNYILGYGPSRQDGVFSSIRIIKQDTIYNVKYTIKDKMRFTPNSNYNSDEYRIFLGCSQIFGEGLNDDETFPYHYNKISGNKYNIWNYGFHGYGSHQALAIVENILATDSTLNTNPEKVQVFYSFYFYHIPRAAGYSFWDKMGPCYEVKGNNLVYNGPFTNKYKIEKTKFIGYIYKRLWLQSNIFNKYSNPKTIDDTKLKDIKRTLFIIREINTILSKKGIDFFLLVDKETSENNLFSQFLSDNNITAICLECEIPDFETNEVYTINGDGHATSKLNELMANLLFKKLQIN